MLPGLENNPFSHPSDTVDDSVTSIIIALRFSNYFLRSSND